MPFTKKLLPLIILSFCMQMAKATNYYFSTALGNDTRSAAEAQNVATPWKTLAKLNTIMSGLRSGDFIFFNRGEVFSGTILTTAITSGAAIVFGAYGSGKNPEITGFTAITSWKNAGSGIWVSALPSAQALVNTVLVNGVRKSIGRYPNITAANKGYLNVVSASGFSSITDPQLSASPNWTGGQVVIRKTRWVLDNSLILAHSGNTISYASQSSTPATWGYGYFIQNHPGTLDVVGEWYYKAASNEFGIFTGGADPSSSTIRVGTVASIVQINGQSNLTFQNLDFTGAVNSAFEIYSAQNIRISNCNVFYSGKNALNITNSSNVTVENSVISNTNNIAFNVINCYNTTLNNNAIKNTGAIPGMGDGETGSYCAVQINGDNNTITNNAIDSTGYIPVSFSGNNILIKNNYISNFCNVKDDGSGIYTWNNGLNPPVNYNRVISGNIITNGIGAGAGVSDTTAKGLAASGIYLDDNVSNVELSGNTITNCATFGMYLHNAYNLTVKSNTLYNNAAVQLEVVHDNIAPNSPVRNLVLTDNIFISKFPTQFVGEFKTKDNDISSFGTFNNNYYARPFDDNLVIRVSQLVNGTFDNQSITLGAWKARYNQDLQSAGSPVRVPAYQVENIIGANKFSNGAFDANTNGLYSYSSAGNSSTSWASGPLDGGNLKVSFSSLKGNSNYASVIAGVGAIVKNKKYLFKFSMVGTDGNKVVTAFLRQSQGSYLDLSDRMTTLITSNRTENQIVFIASADEGDASIVFNIDEQADPVYIDNIVLTEVTASATVPDDYIKLYLNPTATAQAAVVTNPGVDAKNVAYQNSVALQPYSSAVLISNSISSSVTCAATGTILREEWDNVTGNNVADIPLTATPTSSAQLNLFEGPMNSGVNNYGSRIRGYVCPPQTGNYRLWIAGDDATQLWLSTDDSPSNKVKIAENVSWTGYRQWTGFSSQQSALIYLKAGQKYYIEAMQKQGNGGDNLSVQWALPDGSVESPIPGIRLSPYVVTANTACAATGSILREEWDNVSGNDVAQIPVTTTPTSSRQLTMFDSPVNIGNNYGSRVRGYICPPQTGAYTFWVAGDDAVQLWLSTDDNVANKTKIAESAAWTNYLEWNKYGSQKSISINLQAGHKYYIEALQKQGYGADNLSVQWSLPDGTLESPIPGARLSPYVITDAVTCSATGTILREQWSNVNGYDVAQIPVTTSATSSSQLTAFSAPINIGTNYGSRISGYVCPPQTGAYTFWVAGDDAVQLWLSTDDNAANKIKIAESTAWTNYLEWNKYASQKSIPINLLAGHKYYIEALQKQAYGADNLSVQWTLPDGSVESPIPGARLSPAVISQTADCTATGTILREEWDNVSGNNISQIPTTTTPNSSGQLYSLEGPVNSGISNYGSRIRGYICAPYSGKYTFWVAGDDATELWLSTDNNVVNKVKIAENTSWTAYRDWNNVASQRSVPITLQAGHTYYVEALQKQGVGGDNLSVQWVLPNGVFETPIPGRRLSPFVPLNASATALFAGFRASSTSIPSSVNVSAVTPSNLNGTVLQEEILVYPNPYLGEVNIDFTQVGTADVSLTLYNAQGTQTITLFKGKVQDGEKRSLRYDGSKLLNGVYFIRLVSGKTVLVKRVVHL